MQPDEEVTKKILYWMEKLGLNQVIIILLGESIFKLPIKHAISYVFLHHCRQHGTTQEEEGNNNGQHGSRVTKSHIARR